jgi:ParB-like chromosome segregation protein Spo0J
LKLNNRADFCHVPALAIDMARRGIIMPPIYRPAPDGRFQIVAGESRTRAARLLYDWYSGADRLEAVFRAVGTDAGWDRARAATSVAMLETELSAACPSWLTLESPSIIADVRDLSDKEALDVMWAENSVRKNTNPLEEATHLKRLQGDGEPLERIANRVGKSADWCKRRLSLLNLRGEFAALLAKDCLGVGTAEMLARLDSNRQLLCYSRWQTLKEEERLPKRLEVLAAHYRQMQDDEAARAAQGDLFGGADLSGAASIVPISWQQMTDEAGIVPTERLSKAALIAHIRKIEADYARIAVEAQKEIERVRGAAAAQAESARRLKPAVDELKKQNAQLAAQNAQLVALLERSKQQNDLAAQMDVALL